MFLPVVTCNHRRTPKSLRKTLIFGFISRPDFFAFAQIPAHARPDVTVIVRN